MNSQHLHTQPTTNIHTYKHGWAQLASPGRPNADRASVAAQVCGGAGAQPLPSALSVASGPREPASGSGREVQRARGRVGYDESPLHPASCWQETTYINSYKTTRVAARGQVPATQAATLKSRSRLDLGTFSRDLASAKPGGNKNKTNNENTNMNGTAIPLHFARPYGSREQRTLRYGWRARTTSMRLQFCQPRRQNCSSFVSRPRLQTSLSRLAHPCMLLVVLCAVGYAPSGLTTQTNCRLDRRKNKTAFETKNKRLLFVGALLLHWLRDAGSHELASTAAHPRSLLVVFGAAAGASSDAATPPPRFESDHSFATRHQTCSRCFPGSSFSTVCVWTGPRQGACIFVSPTPTSHDKCKGEYLPSGSVSSQRRERCRVREPDQKPTCPTVQSVHQEKCLRQG